MWHAEAMAPGFDQLIMSKVSDERLEQIKQNCVSTYQRSLLFDVAIAHKVVLFLSEGMSCCRFANRQLVKRKTSCQIITYITWKPAQWQKTKTSCTSLMYVWDERVNGWWWQEGLMLQTGSLFYPRAFFHSYSSFKHIASHDYNHFSKGTNVGEQSFTHDVEVGSKT